MASKSEKTFGARLLRAQTLHQYISNFNNYAPPRYEESSAGFLEFLQTISTTNTEEAMLRQQYNTTVTNRAIAFRDGENSIFKMLTLLRSVVLAQYGRNSLELSQVDANIRHMREAKLIFKAATENTPEEKISQSEQSYGSVTQQFSDLVAVLSQLPGYNPSNSALQVAQLQALISQLNQLNMEAASRYQQLKNVRSRRRNLYKELNERMVRIKAYVKGNYGSKSQEYTLVREVKV